MTRTIQLVFISIATVCLFNLPLLMEGRDQRRDVVPKLEALEQELLVLEHEKDSMALVLLEMDSIRYYPMSQLLRLDAQNYRVMRARVEWIKHSRCGTWRGACSAQPPRGR